MYKHAYSYKNTYFSKQRAYFSKYMHVFIVIKQGGMVGLIFEEYLCVRKIETLIYLEEYERCLNK